MLLQKHHHHGNIFQQLQILEVTSVLPVDVLA